MNTRQIISLAVVLALAAATAAAQDSVRARPYGNKVIAITFVNGSFRTKSATTVSNYTVTGPSGNVTVSSVGREAKIDEYIETTWPYTPIMANTVYLLLGGALQENASYSVAVSSSVTTTAWTLPVVLRSTDGADELIKINQCGYLPTSKKLAYLGGYLGSKGALDLTAISGQFWLVNLNTQQKVFQGTATLSKSGDGDSGENVYWLDFTSFTTPGTYAIEVAGIGRSYSFTIGDDAFAPALATLARGLYHQRCGLELKAPYTTWPHPACHRMLAKLVTVYDSMDDIMSSLPSLVDPRNINIDGWGGWHDAGDYDRLGSRHRVVVSDLLEAYESNPDRFVDGQFNIPEKGNGIPDVLDEAKWGLDWFERVYDPTDGGFYYRIDTPDYGSTMPQYDNQQLYCMAKYPYYSTYVGACFAQASRLFRPYNAALADHYLAIARNALAYGKAHISSDSRMPTALGALAAEIYVTAGDASAQQSFISYGYRGVLSYALCTRPDINATAKAAARSYFTNDAQTLLNAKHASGYVTCFSSTLGGDEAMFDALTLLRGYRVSGRADFLEAALQSLDHHLGANPLGYCWITGVGSHYPKKVLHIPSENDGIDEPVPGIPIFGARGADQIAGSTHGDLFNTKLYPAYSGYPYLRSYSELPGVVEFSEFVIASQSAGMIAYAYFTPVMYTNPPSRVLGCYVFYNNSKFDARDPAATPGDDAAIAPDKTPLLPGQTATFANYTSYSLGINGVMIDISGLPSDVTVDDFDFQTGNTSTLSQWYSAVAPTSVTIRRGAGVEGSDRVVLIWPDGAIKKRWLRVTVKATANTGLPLDYVFYYGNAIGDTGDSATSAQVNAADLLQVRQDPHKTALNPAEITNACDFNRSGNVDTMDESLVRMNMTTVVSELSLIVAP